MKKNIENRNARGELHGYQEGWMRENRDTDVFMINFRGNCINDLDVGYQEYHRPGETEYYII